MTLMDEGKPVSYNVLLDSSQLLHLMLGGNTVRVVETKTNQTKSRQGYLLRVC